MGEIGRVDFAGYFYEVDILLPGFQIMVRIRGGRYARGEPVYISIDYDNYHP
jgi:hypothetical protein